MKSPSLKTTAAVLGITVPRQGDLTAIINGLRVLAFTGASWQRRTINSVRVFPRKRRAEKGGYLVPDGSGIREVAALTRNLAVRLGFPVTGEFNKVMFTSSPDGTLTRTNGRSIFRRTSQLP